MGKEHSDTTVLHKRHVVTAQNDDITMQYSNEHLLKYGTVQVPCF